MTTKIESKRKIQSPEGTSRFVEKKKWKLASAGNETIQHQQPSLSGQTERFRNRNALFDTIGDKQLKSDKQPCRYRVNVWCVLLLFRTERDKTKRHWRNRINSWLEAENKYNCSRNRAIFIGYEDRWIAALLYRLFVSLKKSRREMVVETLVRGKTDPPTDSSVLSLSLLSFDSILSRQLYSIPRARRHITWHYETYRQSSRYISHDIY
jgi:hypothetical protein